VVSITLWLLYARKKSSIDLIIGWEAAWTPDLILSSVVKTKIHGCATCRNSNRIPPAMLGNDDDDDNDTGFIDVYVKNFWFYFCFA
jgi:hypothetical protein